MGKKKNKARQLALNASQAQNQPPQPFSNPPAASDAVAQTAAASSAAPSKKEQLLVKKAEKRRRRKEIRMGKDGEAMRDEAEDLTRDAEPLEAPGQPATAFFSAAPSSQNTRPTRQSRRTARNNSFVGNALLNVLEEVQGNNSSLPQGIVPATAPNGLAMGGSNDKPMSSQSISTPDGAQERAQDMSGYGYNSALTMPPPVSAMPATPGAPYGYNMANAMWNWNNEYSTGLGEGHHNAQASGYQSPAPASNRQDPGPMAGAWSQASALPPGFPAAPSAMGQFAYVNPTWQAQGQLGPAGFPPWLSPHQQRTMGPTQYRGFATDSQTTPSNGQHSVATSGPRSPHKSPRAERPNKPGPPRPNPSPKYLAQSLMRSYHFTVPQRLLIVIDLNGTLLFRPKARQPSHFIRRPFARPFISYLVANHTVMVWSSARPENVQRMCSGLFSPTERQQLKAEWGRDMLGLTEKQYNDKVQVYKELRKVWEVANAQEWHPMHHRGERFDQRNTLLIDDSVEKAASEPYNLVEVDDFEAKQDQMSRDVLREVAGYIEDARLQTDVSAWCRAGNKFAYGQGWDREWQEAMDEAPSAPSDLVSPGQAVPSAGHLGDGLVPPASPPDKVHLGQEQVVRITRSQKKKKKRTTPHAKPDSPPSTGDTVVAAAGQTTTPGNPKLNRKEKRRLRGQQEQLQKSLTT